MNEAVEIMQKWRRAKLTKQEYFSLVEDGYLTVGIAPMRMGIPVEDFEKMMGEWQEQDGEVNKTDIFAEIRKDIEWVVLREYVLLVRKGYITVEHAAERLHKTPEEVQSWVNTFETIRGFLDEGKEENEEGTK